MAGQKVWRNRSTEAGTSAPSAAVTCALHEQVSSSMTQSVDLPVAESGRFLLGGDRPVYGLGFGAMRLTGKGIWGEPADRSEAIRVVRRAVELGVNFIDTADSYGPDVSEGLIAEALYPYPEGVVIATKGGLERPGPDQ